jgi:ATP-dependent DNA helicase DinG
VLTLDECHSLERQILSFIEVAVTQEGIREWTPSIRLVPPLNDISEFLDFLSNTYLPVLEMKAADLAAWQATEDSPKERKIAKDKADLDQHVARVVQGINYIKRDPDNWVFSQEVDRKGNPASVAKPLDAAPFAQELILCMGAVRIFMSAYPGSKAIFSHSLGLDPDEVAWINLDSTFPVKNRPIYLTTTGSMSRRNREASLPNFMEFVKSILDCHKDTRGLIHVASYELGKIIYEELLRTEHARRLLYPECAEERETIFEQHKASKEPTIIITPSMMEGFDFVDDLSRWQIIAKVPYPYLGDKQTFAKKEMDPQWYDLQAVSSIIQATGRIVRSEKDFGISYILDSDFLPLYSRCKHLFPKWWTAAVIWPKKKESQNNEPLACI